MSQNLPYTDPPGVEVDDGDKPVLISRNVKHGEFTDLVCASIEGTNWPLTARAVTWKSI
jgi:hypothetical protein